MTAATPLPHIRAVLQYCCERASKAVIVEVWKLGKY
jgi:hypothetical protein